MYNYHNRDFDRYLRDGGGDTDNDPTRNFDTSHRHPGSTPVHDEQPLIHRYHHLFSRKDVKYLKENIREMCTCWLGNLTNHLR